MSEMECKTFIYGAAQLRGHQIDWETGAIRPRKT